MVMPPPQLLLMMMLIHNSYLNMETVIKGVHWDRRGRDSLAKIWTQVQQPTFGRNIKTLELFPVERGVCAPHQGHRAGEAGHQSTWPGKPLESMSRRTIELWGVENLLHCLHAGSETPVQKHQFEKCLNHMWILILKHLLERQESAGTLSAALVEFMQPTLKMPLDHLAWWPGVWGCTSGPQGLCCTQGLSF